MSNELHALVRAGVVENVIVWDGIKGETWSAPGDAPEGWLPFSLALGVGITLVAVPGGLPVQSGWRFEEDAFIAPPETERPTVVPASVSQRQGRLALVDTGLYAQVLGKV